MLCKYCHQEILDNSRYCTNCGSAQEITQPTQPDYYSPQPPQPGYATSQPMLTYQTPPQKKKTWLIFLIIGVLATGLLIAGGIAIVSLFNGGSQTKYWNGGYNSPELPNGYTAIVANDYLIVGVGEAYPYYESDGSTTLQIDIYIINKSGNAIYLLFLDNAFDGKMAPYSDVYVSVLRTEAGDTDKGVIYIDSLHDPKDLKKWTGTLKVVDDDTFYDPNPITLDEYFFDLTYRR